MLTIKGAALRVAHPRETQHATTPGNCATGSATAEAGTDRNPAPVLALRAQHDRATTPQPSVAQAPQPRNENEPDVQRATDRRERLAEQAAGKLRQHPDLKRAAQIEPDGLGRFIVAVAVRMPDGIVTVIVRNVCADDGLLLHVAFERACEARIQ